jgi:hypothetical protein
MDNELKRAAVDFLEDFEQVFDRDWKHNEARLEDGFFIEPNGTFLHPGVEDESSNWANRGASSPATDT